MEFTLRPATVADYRWLWELKRLTMQLYVEQTWGSWDEAAQEAFFRRTFSANTVQVILVDGAKAGLLEVTRDAEEVFLANIQIHPSHQGRGLGSAVIRGVQASSHLLQLPVRLQVLKVNARAQRLYERLSFTVYGENPTHVLMRWRPTPGRPPA